MKSKIQSEAAAPWQEQFARTKRWRDRLRTDAFEQLFRDSDVDWQPDIIYAFFLNCYHLRDWIANSGIAAESELDVFIRDNHELKVCRDIANGSKHLRLRKPSLKSGPKFTRRVDMRGNAMEKAPSSIMADDKRYDIQELADRCMGLWMDFLKNKLGGNCSAFLWTAMTK